MYFGRAADQLGNMEWTSASVCDRIIRNNQSLSSSVEEEEKMEGKFRKIDHAVVRQFMYGIFVKEKTLRAEPAENIITGRKSI